MIDYEALQQDALRGIVRAALQQIAKTGLPGEHHFYISFRTQSPGVVLSKRLKEKYPDEMTIVLQHRFWDLIVSEDRFEVKLTFDGVPERLVVPLSAIKVFIDPSVHFGLQFEDAADRPQTAPRRSMTMDAAYDAVSDARPDSPRATLTKKPRSPRKSRAEKEAEAAARKDGSNESAPVPPQPEPASAAATEFSEDAQTAQPAQAEDDKAGSKVISLDAFRKK